MKICKETKEVIFFYKRKSSKDGLRSQCISCEKQYKLDNNDRIKDYGKKYKSNNYIKIREKGQQYYSNNKERIIEYSKNYRLNNLLELNFKRNKRRKNKYINDILYYLQENIRASINTSFSKKNYSKSSRTFEILGCSFEEFKIHLESKFEFWMNWDNKGLYNGELNYGWDIDHIIPLSSATTEEELTKLNHYTNLQPLCSYINRVVKKDKINWVNE